MSQRKEISFKNIQLQYSISGSGQPVVLIHGFGEDSQIWDGLKDELQNDFKIIVPDVPGSGGSETLHGKNINIEDYADGIHAILQNENIDKCMMAGHSMGGYITLAFAKKYPNHLSAIALIHSTAYPDDNAKKETRQKAIQFISKNGSEAFLKTAVPDLFADKKKDESNINELIERVKNIEPGVLVQYYQAMMNRSCTTDVLESARFPILFIMGEHDKAVPLPHGLQQCHIPEISEIAILRNSGHMGMLEEKSKTLQVFTHFLQGIYV